MTTVHIGLPSTHGSVARYATNFDLLEIRPVDTSLPRPSKLRQWRKDVPPAFAYSVVVPSALASLKALPQAQLDETLKTTLDTAAALEARCLVVTTPVDVTPTALHKKRLAALFEKFPRDAVLVGWEPRGVWSAEEAASWAHELGVHLIVDASQQEPPRGPTMYTRLRGIGVQAQLGAGATARVRASMSGRREVFVVVECNNPKRVANALRVPLDDAPRAAMPTVVRPRKLSAEDEEQE